MAEDQTLAPKVKPDRPWEQLESLLDGADPVAIDAFLSELPPGDAERAISRLDVEHRDRVLALLDPERAAWLLEHLSDAQCGQLLDHAEPGEAAAILEELSSDEQADMIGAMSGASAERVLAEMTPAAKAAADEIVAFDAESAGGLMMTRFVSFEGGRTAAQVVAELHERAEEVRDYEVQYLYVVDPDGKLHGVLPLRELLLTPGHEPVERVMIANPISVPLSMELEDLADFFEEHAFLGVPVIDDSGRLRGIVHRTTVDEAWAERAEGDLLKARGIVGGEELRSMPLLLRSRRRLSWLSTNIVLNVAAASVIAAYQDTLEAVIALAVFLPIISDMSGCSGNQAVAVSMRELTLGVIKPMDVFHVWRKEISVGLVNGIVLGVLIACAAWLWKGDPTLGFVVGLALALNTLVAVSIGGAVPARAQALRLRPGARVGSDPDDFDRHVRVLPGAEPRRGVARAVVGVQPRRSVIRPVPRFPSRGPSSSAISSNARSNKPTSPPTVSSATRKRRTSVGSRSESRRNSTRSMAKNGSAPGPRRKPKPWARVTGSSCAGVRPTRSSARVSGRPQGLLCRADRTRHARFELRREDRIHRLIQGSGEFPQPRGIRDRLGGHRSYRATNRLDGPPHSESHARQVTQ